MSRPVPRVMAALLAFALLFARRLPALFTVSVHAPRFAVAAACCALTPLGLVGKPWSDAVAGAAALGAIASSLAGMAALS